MSKVGIALSGGGARGFGHIGVLKALLEHNIKPNVVAGSSAGGLIGAFYAAGYSMDELADISKKTNFFSLKNLLFGKPGFFSMNSIEKLVLKYIPHNSFEKLSMPLTIATTDIVKGETLYFSEGKLSTALMATACLPMINDPVKHNNTYLVDGGVLNNFPIEPLLNKCDTIIGVNVNARSKNMADIQLKNMLDRSFHLAISNTVENKIKQCQLYICPNELSKYGMFDMNKIDEIINCAYKYTIQLLSETNKRVL